MRDDFDVIVIGGGPAGENAPAGADVAATLRSRDSFSSNRDEGYLGVEIAQALRRLGAAEVTVVERADRLLATEEPFVGHQLRETFEAEGIIVLVDAEPVRAGRDGAGPVTLTLADGTELVADEIVVAAGRRPNAGRRGLEAVWLQPGRSIVTDDQLRPTEVDGGWSYALGDVNGRPLLTHDGEHQTRLVSDNLAGKDVEARADPQTMVRVVFTDPQVAAVGPTLAAAREQGLDVEAIAFGVGDVAGGALLGKRVSGTAKLVVDRRARTIVGATFTGPGAGEMLRAATIAIVSGITLDELWHAVPAFPTGGGSRLLEADRGVS